MKEWAADWEAALLFWDTAKACRSVELELLIVISCRSHCMGWLCAAWQWWGTRKGQCVCQKQNWGRKQAEYFILICTLSLQALKFSSPCSMVSAAAEFSIKLLLLLACQTATCHCCARNNKDFKKQTKKPRKPKKTPLQSQKEPQNCLNLLVKLEPFPIWEQKDLKTVLSNGFFHSSWGRGKAGKERNYQLQRDAASEEERHCVGVLWIPWHIC